MRGVPGPPTQSPPDDWDRIELLTRRVGRWMLVGIASWLVLLALLNEAWTGIPLEIGFVMASVLALIVVVVDDQLRRGPRRGKMTPFARVLVTWVGAFVVLAIGISLSGGTGVAIVLVPFIGATLIAAMIEIGRRALARD